MAVINENVQKLLEERYFFKDSNTGEVVEKTAEEMFRRVAKHVAMAEKPELRDKYEEIFYELMDRQLFMPNTPTLIGAGYKNKCLSACSVLPRVPDSLEGIYKHVWHNAKLTKYGCGVGQDLSDIRPKGEIIKSSGGQSAGVINWMELIDSVANTTIQGDKARRAANMVSLRFNHPDIFDFIQSKQSDGKLSAMNISVVITNEEMKKVINNEYIDLVWNGKIYKTVKAREIFDLIIDGLHHNGEPGILWIDVINNDNPFNLKDGKFDINNPHYIKTTNPCFTGDMKLLTSDGYKTFAELEGKVVDIINADGEISRGKIWCSGEKDVVELIFANGNSIKCTPDHVFKLNDGSECQAKDLKRKRLMPYLEKSMHHDELYIKLGFIQGGGNLNELNKDQQKITINIGKKDEEILDLFGFVRDRETKRHFITGEFNKILLDLRFSTNTLPEREFPRTYSEWTKKQKASFLRGCYSANGSVVKGHRVSYKTTCYNFALQLKEALAEFDINAYITTNKPRAFKLDNGEYLSKESYSIEISRFLDVIKFYTNIGFVHKYKEKALVDLIRAKSPMVMTVKHIGKEKVYDFNEPLTNWGVVNGFVAHNCGEQPLEDYEFCNLGSINVENLYNEETNDINWDLFEHTIKMGMRFLDDIIDINEYVLPEFKEKVLGNRKIGLGVTGWANLLIKMGIRYDSKQALGAIDAIMGFKRRVEQEYNTELALEKGNFPNWHESIYAKTNTPARCSAVSTQAPTGSISSILNTTAYGIEPHFGVAYKRRIVTGEIYEANELFAKMLHEIVNDKEKEQEIIKECYEKGTTQLECVPLKLRELFRCANDISPEWHVKTQARFQKYYDNAISKTINAPEDATKDELYSLLIDAWQMGIKGITYYRNNSRKNQTIQIGDKKDGQVGLDRGDVIKAPEVARGITYKLVSGCGNLYLNVTYDENGNINQTFVNKGSSGTCRSNQEAVSRLISLALRGGISIEKIVDQLKSVDICTSYSNARAKGKKVSKGSSCPHAIAFVLEKASKENIEPIQNKSKIESDIVKANLQDSKDKCPECGESIFQSEGCIRCVACSFTRCD